MFEIENFLLDEAKIPVKAGVFLGYRGKELFKCLDVAVTSDELVNIIIGFDVEVVAPGAFVRVSVRVSFFLRQKVEWHHRCLRRCHRQRRRSQHCD